MNGLEIINRKWDNLHDDYKKTTDFFFCDEFNVQEKYSLLNNIHRKCFVSKIKKEEDR